MSDPAPFVAEAADVPALRQALSHLGRIGYNESTVRARLGLRDITELGTGAPPHLSGRASGRPRSAGAGDRPVPAAGSAERGGVGTGCFRTVDRRSLRSNRAARIRRRRRRRARTGLAVSGRRTAGLFRPRLAGDAASGMPACSLQPGDGGRPRQPPLSACHAPPAHPAPLSICAPDRAYRPCWPRATPGASWPWISIRAPCAACASTPRRSEWPTWKPPRAICSIRWAASSSISSPPIRRLFRLLKIRCGLRRVVPSGEGCAEAHCGGPAGSPRARRHGADGHGTGRARGRAAGRAAARMAGRRSPGHPCFAGGYLQRRAIRHRPCQGRGLWSVPRIGGRAGRQSARAGLCASGLRAGDFSAEFRGGRPAGSAPRIRGRRSVRRRAKSNPYSRPKAGPPSRFGPPARRSWLRRDGPIALLDASVLGGAIARKVRATRLGRALSIEEELDPLEHRILKQLEVPAAFGELLRKADSLEVDEAAVIAAVRALLRRRLVCLGKA